MQLNIEYRDSKGHLTMGLLCTELMGTTLIPEKLMGRIGKIGKLHAKLDFGVTHGTQFDGVKSSYLYAY